MASSNPATIHCANKACQKVILSQCALAEGSRFVVRCFHCGSDVKIIATFHYIQKRLLEDLHEQRIISNEQL